MSNYFFAGTDLKQLYGHSFTLPSQGGPSVTFRIPSPATGWPRGGLEAYGLLVDCDHPSRGAMPSFLKLFKMEVPHRQERSHFLVHLGLARHHPWLFQGMPYVSFKGHSINGVKVFGHVAQRIQSRGAVAEDISRLRSMDAWDYPRTDRKRFAGHLCVAVAALESLSLVHGDISSRNVMIGTAPDGQPAAILCDFDGFFHPGQPVLPRLHNNMPCRPLGSSGYQYPELVEDLAADRDTWVRSDRFALAVMVCEMMIWDDEVAQELDRYELLTDEIIQRRDLRLLPKSVTRKWQDGCDLLQTALSARDISQFPAPQAWLDLLEGLPPATHLDFPDRPHLNIYRRRGNNRHLVRKIRLQSDQGDLSSIHRELADVRFQFSKNRLSLDLRWNVPVLVRRNDKLADLGKGPRRVELQSGDSVLSNQWELEIRDSPETH